METTFAATFGAGGNSIGMSLRYFGIIERSTSPGFQLFDGFPDRCARKIYISRSDHDDREANSSCGMTAASAAIFTSSGI